MHAGNGMYAFVKNVCPPQLSMYGQCSDEDFEHGPDSDTGFT